MAIFEQNPYFTLQKNTMPTLHALLIAINDYPDPKHRLSGCVNDLESVRQYLEVHSSVSGLGFNARVLTDEQATRANFIKGFEHFHAAQAGDTCLFYYAGHGAYCDAPEVFWHLSPSRRVESIVCWDSRQAGGRDLMDKELSFLIWQATQGKDIHFVAITDCCHSGSITRGVKERLIREIGTAVPPEEYLGFEQYRPAGEGRFSPPRGRYVHLGAARDNQTAKEVQVQGAPRGVFTHCLLEALSGSNGQISYAELANRVNMRIRDVVAEQSPQVDALPTEDKDRLFLSGVLATGKRAYLIGFDNTMGWFVNAGALHGILAGDEQSPTVFQLVDDEHSVRATEVLAQRTKVEGMDGFDPKKQYPAKLTELAAPRLRLATAAESQAEAITLLSNLLGRKNSDFFQLVPDANSADFLVHAKAGAYFLSRRFDEQPLFQKVMGYEEASAVDFVNKLEKVANWLQLLRLSNPATSINAEEITIELYRVTEPGNTEDDAPVELVDWCSPTRFEYVGRQGKWVPPGFQFKVKNTGQRALWVSLLFLADDFGITNQILPKQALEPGQEAWAADVFEGHPYRTLSLDMEDYYLERGIHTLDEYLKLIICTDEFDTDNFNQEGLPPEGALLSHRKVGFRRQSIRKPDWTVREVHMQLHRKG